MNLENSDFNRKAKVAIVSAFGRGNWLAMELAQLGLEVSLIDVSEDLGRCAPEDWEGPHGYFQSDSLLQSQKVCLSEEDYAEDVAEGFVVWLRSGPFDTQTQLSSYMLEQREIGPEILDYISRYADMKPKERATAAAKIISLPFAKNWFAQFAHSLSATDESESTEAMSVGRPAPFFSPYSIRRASRRGLESSLDRLRDLGVTVRYKVKIKDLRCLQNTVLNIEIESKGWSGIVDADQFVWMISSLETEKISARAIEAFFANESLAPTWCWMRYSFDLAQNYAYEVLPKKFVMIDDLALPWVRNNMQWVQKSETKNRFDVWIKVPYAHRFQKKYIEEMSRHISHSWEARIPKAKFTLANYPQEYENDGSTLGPSRFPIYNQKKRTSMYRKNFNNIHYDGPEVWDSYHRYVQFEASVSIYNQIKSWNLEFNKMQEKLRAKAFAERNT